MNIISDSKNLFILYLLISGNYIGELFGCKVQYFLQKNMVLKHILGFITLLFFVIFVDESNNKIENPNKTILKASALYIWFLITTRTNYKYLFAIVLLLFLLVIIEKFKKYYEYQKEKEKVDYANKISKILSYLSALITIMGFLVYLNDKYQKEYGKIWSWKKFILGKEKCNFDKQF